MRRPRSLRDPVTLTLDGRSIPAERGEPVAVALIGAGNWTLARSPKFHRPRGPSCLRAACDGCLARVNGVPNVMTCRVPAQDGLAVETQNVIGSREADWLRMADWFFPVGMNHHELVAGVPVVQSVMQVFARRIAGTGRLPDAPAPTSRAVRRTADVLVVGAGPAGMAAALELSDRGRTVEVVDDDLERGGSLHGLVRSSRTPAAPVERGGTQPPPRRKTSTRSVEGVWQDLLARFDAAVSSRVRFRSRTTAAGIYGADVLLVSADLDADPRAEVVTARSVVLAPGCHDGVLAFEGNDLPGILSARAACRLLEAGVVPGRRAVMASHDGGTAFGSRYETLRVETVVVRDPIRRAHGTGQVRAVTVAGDGTERRIPCDVLLVDVPGAPSYELCAQAGGALQRSKRGFVVRADPDGRIAPGFFAVGEVTGAPLEPDAVLEGARRLAC